jgi:carbon starvation protein CstA
LNTPPTRTAVALALGTTVLIKMGRTRYVWVTLAPQILQVVTGALVNKKRPRALIMLLALIGTILAGA